MKHFSLLAFFLVLTACGFTPVYSDRTENGDHSSPQHSLESIEIATILNHEGQALRNELIDRLYHGGYPSLPLYRLETRTVSETIIKIGIDKDDNASRAQMRQSTGFNLIRLSDGKTVLKRTVRATTGYNILAGQFTTFVTENDARDQGIRTLANNITTQLELYFSRQDQ